MDPLAELKQTFFQECEELLGALEQKLQALDEGSTDSEDVNAAFRAIHSIKGGAGAFGCTELVGFAHVFEAALDHLRSGRVALEDAPFTLFLRCSDAVADLVAAARNDEVAPVRPDLLAALEQVGQAKAAAPAAPAADAPVGIAALGNLLAMVDAKMGAPAPAAPAAANDGWDDDEPVAAAPARRPGNDVRIKITPEADLFRRVIEPRVAIGILPAEEIVSVACDLSHVPALETLDVTDCHMRFTVMMRTELSADEIVAKFDFTLANEEFEVEVLPDTEAAAEPMAEAAPAAAPEVPQNVAADLSAILARLGPAADAAPQPDIQPAAAPAAAPVAAAPAAAPAAARAAARPVSNEAAARQRQAVSVRVDLDRIDRLMNLVGEIVITQSMLVECVRSLPYDVYAKTAEGILTLSRQTRELQDHVMAVRAQPVKAVFQRMPRLVRELAQTLGKEVKLVLEGENTEVDKTIIEELADPLTHMIRNSMDHGVETPEERIAAGKNPEGTIRLIAEHRAGRIVISVTDDGRGIGRDRLLAKAKSRGLVGADEKLAPEEIDQLIFAAGLSTADAVSDISGRGVGMDVVRRNVESLGGRISVDSEPGRGCKFTLALPLTLAVLEGMVIRCGDDRYVIPIASVIETQHLANTPIEHLTFGQEVLRWRGEITPLHRLGAVMGSAGTRDENIIIIAETERGGNVGIAVDEIVGQQQVVVKSLESNYGAVAGASAATILGDGLVALILDVDSMLRVAASGTRQPAPELKLAG
ncbi:chemotaxis protein CheA [Bosea sp. (in: a-proteobacteria)]|jgi:two-component system chemotaxis sensor kinase CheA|uniref:chemotaxis protein CheA n=1 Tax=Bosea sp. (in: a-proteobacteria) TaxID=1871050 RepID=UPI002DDC91C8|nr:chemotaxis protein CheA [Bosea sp. (in: a-proteobacteria)]HEV2511181.1 chemotaxis protein CheA [Bosea sp. (in: a-proteobacteria)]